MKDWEHYRFILAVQRAGTVRGAAGLLGVNHATVSRRLSQINEDYGQPVFDRTAEGYQPTQLGLQLVLAAEQMEEITFSAVRQQRALETELSGPIKLSLAKVIAQFLLRDELTDFVNRHPNIDLSIETSYKYVDLDRSEADIVIRAANSPPDHLVGRRLFPYALCHYCHVDYLKNTPPKDRKWLSFSPRADAKKWIATSPYPHAPIGLQIDDLTFLHRAVVAGKGMTFVACYMADPEERLVRLPGSQPQAIADLWVLTHPDLRDTPRIQALMKFLTAALIEKRGLIEGRF